MRGDGWGVRGRFLRRCGDLGERVSVWTFGLCFCLCGGVVENARGGTRGRVALRSGQEEMWVEMMSHRESKFLECHIYISNEAHH